MPKWNSYSEYYRQELFPYAIEYGMTAQEFWEYDPSLFWSYRISYMRKKKTEQEIQNQMMWVQGAYIYDAVSKAIANSFSKNAKYNYIEKPFELNQGHKAIQKEEMREKVVMQNNYWANYKERLENK